MNKWNTASVVHDLQQIRKQWREKHHRNGEYGGTKFPSKSVLQKLMLDLCAILFPMRLGPTELSQENENDYISYTLDHVLHDLYHQVQLALCEQQRLEMSLTAEIRSVENNIKFAINADCGISQQAETIVRKFSAELPHIRSLIDRDICAAYEGDPSAHSVDEILICYPGVLAIIYYRIAHLLYSSVPLIARIISETAHTLTGIDIHPGAKIDQGFFIDHGTGVVIGETCIIGQRVRIYQAVTLGAKSFELDEYGGLKKDYPRHPIIEDDVVIYAGATLLGRITIGQRSVIGGNVWLTSDVGADSHILQSPIACFPSVKQAKSKHI